MNNSPLLIDTNIIIDFLRGQHKAISYFQAIPMETQLQISTIVVTELFTGAKNEKERDYLEFFLKDFSKIPLEYEIAKKGGRIKKNYGPSHGIGIADAIIAATALHHNTKLITLNLKHFPMVELKEAPY